MGCFSPTQPVGDIRKGVNRLFHLMLPPIINLNRLTFTFLRHFRSKVKIALNV